MADIMHPKPGDVFRGHCWPGDGFASLELEEQTLQEAGYNAAKNLKDNGDDEANDHVLIVEVKVVAIGHRRPGVYWEKEGDKHEGAWRQESLL